MEPRSITSGGPELVPLTRYLERFAVVSLAPGAPSKFSRWLALLGCRHAVPTPALNWDVRRAW
eukprot:209689-Alexandrium_andersonii.AAC.1